MQFLKIKLYFTYYLKYNYIMSLDLLNNIYYLINFLPLLLLLT